MQIVRRNVLTRPVPRTQPEFPQYRIPRAGVGRITAKQRNARKRQPELLSRERLEPRAAATPHHAQVRLEGFVRRTEALVEHTIDLAASASIRPADSTASPITDGRRAFGSASTDVVRQSMRAAASAIGATYASDAIDFASFNSPKNRNVTW